MSTSTVLIQRSTQAEQHEVSYYIDRMQEELHRLEQICDGEALSVVRSLKCELFRLQHGSVFGVQHAVQWLRMVDSSLVHILSQRHPDLSMTELKICVMIKYQLSTKEIACLLGISYRSAENHRYRLRKKLHLEKDQSVFAYLVGVSVN